MSQLPTQAPTTEDSALAHLPQAKAKPDLTDGIIQPWSMEAYADSLMDELFADVDRILSGEVADLAVLDGSAELDQPQVAGPLGDPIVDNRSWLSTAGLAASSASGAPSGLSVPDAASLDRVKQQNRLFDRLLVGTAFASLMITTAVWAALNQQRISATLALLSGQNPAAQVNLAAQQAEADARFADYVAQSLRQLETDARDAQIATAPNLAGNSAIPAGANPAPPQVLERIYIPVYQPPQTLLPPTIAQAPGAAAPTAPAAPTTPASTISLVGIVDLGERSMALFEIDGASQRVAIGEKIGITGWVLVRVENQEAVIQRNGETRRLFVGQKTQ